MSANVMAETKQKWDKIHAKADACVKPAACHVLTDNTHLLPKEGVALDIACGLGGNALLLAEYGFNAIAVDISSVAIEQIKSRQHPLIDARCESVEACGLAPASFNVIVVSNYLDRTICDAISDALMPGGLLFYQTFVQDKANAEVGPRNPDYLLKENELLELFASLKVLVYSDLGRQGNTEAGFRNQSCLVAQRRV